MSQGPTGWVDRLIGWCFGLLLGAIALYCAGRLVEAVLPTLIVIVGGLAFIGVAIGGVVVFRTWRDRW